MTETSPISLGNPAAATRRPGDGGFPFPSTRIRIVDPDDPAKTSGSANGRTADRRAAGLRWILELPGGDRSGPAARRLASYG